MKRTTLFVAVGAFIALTAGVTGVTAMMSTSGSHPPSQPASGQRPLMVIGNQSGPVMPPMSMPDQMGAQPMPPTSTMGAAIGNGGMVNKPAPKQQPARQPGAMTMQVTLRSMPTGSVTFGRDGSGALTAEVKVAGLTPGSVHTVEIDSPNAPIALTTFANVTANSLGQANATVGSLETAQLPHGAVFAIRLGLHGGDNNGNLAAAERIATTGALAAIRQVRRISCSRPTSPPSV